MTASVPAYVPIRGFASGRGGGRPRNLLHLTRFAPLLALWLALSGSLVADDWPGWMGPNRDGVYRESGVIDAIPESGLPVKWRAEIAGGYAGPAVADGRVFVFDYLPRSGDAVNDPGTRAILEGEERLLAFDAVTGRPLWQHAYDCPYAISYPAGPRCTPTVDGNRVYTLGSEGDLRCLDVTSGELVWSRSFKRDFDAEVPIWGFASHPLVDGDLLITMVGGTGQGVVAFDKRTGEVRWQALDAKAGYCPPSIVEAGGKRQLIIFHPDAVESLDPADGSRYWDVPIRPSYEMSIARPMVEGDRMYASGIGEVAVMLRLSADRPEVEELWRGQGRRDSVYASNATPILAGGVIYGADCGKGALIAADAADGTRLWETFRPIRPDEERRLSHGTAFLTRLGDSDRYLLMSEIGDLIIASLTPEGYEEHGRFPLLEPTGEAFGRAVVWSHPAYAGRTAYARNDREIVAVDLSK